MPAYIRPDFERNLANTRMQLGDIAFEKAFAEGRAMTLKQAKACAFDAKVCIS